MKKYFRLILLSLLWVVSAFLAFVRGKKQTPVFRREFIFKQYFREKS